MLFSDDTIAAVSTPPGPGARAIVRLSGSQSLAIAAGVFVPSRGRLEQLCGFRAVDGVVKLREGDIELPARAYVFRRPRSYTRQDLVELHVPGCPAVTAQLLGELTAAGARRATAGEFTARAFFGGRISLAGAEEVADVIDAESDAQLRLARHGRARLEQLCRSVSDELAEALATVEASIDLADEDIQLQSPAELAEQLRHLMRQLEALAAEAQVIADSRQLPSAVLVGRPNVGKSSLLNALSGTDRAIVSAMAGTTRDVLTATLELPGGAALLQDAAGLDRPDSPMDALAHRSARDAVARADVLLLVTDASDESGESQGLLDEVRSLNARARLLRVINKIDLPGSRERIAGLAAGGPCVLVSAATGEGLSGLRDALAGELHLAGRSAQATVGLHLWQKQCLTRCGQALGQASDLLNGAGEIADVAELAAIELRLAIEEVGTIVGSVLNEQILGRIFARFCVGK